MVLNGLERAVNESIFPLTKDKNMRMLIKSKNEKGGKMKISLGVCVIRYADDFVIIARSKHIIVNYVKPAIVKFLAERGLSLSTEKTKLFTLSDEKSKLNYLGYTLQFKSK
jgi:hypothetical protein